MEDRGREALTRQSALAAGIGRPYIWGLASFGQEGVEKVLEILRGELSIAMQQAGTRRVAEINRSFVVDGTNRT